MRVQPDMLVVYANGDDPCLGIVIGQNEYSRAHWNITVTNPQGEAETVFAPETYLKPLCKLSSAELNLSPQEALLAHMADVVPLLAAKAL